MFEQGLSGGQAAYELLLEPASLLKQREKQAVIRLREQATCSILADSAYPLSTKQITREEGLH